MYKSLIIANTPLHCLIIKSILKESKPKTGVFLVYLTKNINKKDLNYFNKINLFFENSILIDLNSSAGLIQLFKLLLTLRKKKFKSIYIGQLKTAFNRVLLLSTINYTKKYGEIYSYDDGIGNLNVGGYFDVIKEHWISSFIFKVFNKNLLYKNLKTFISCHFTIFPPDFNIFPNSTFVSLLDLSNSLNKPSNNNTINILLTTPYYDIGRLSKQISVGLFNNVIEKYKIDYLLPHPKDTLMNNYKINQSKIIDTNMIAEEWILKLLKYNTSNVKLFAFGSSTLLTMMNIPGVEVIYLTNPYAKINTIFKKMNIRSEAIV
ncbi:glycosyltransferase family 52 [Marivirga sp.]|uniref:glycosyltransferase family 52 n=1 Tax=Marivirga sp. TaxID=2018662 RepID=UPI002D800A6A|nr:glycosyltransferase family 52 [Marivirga sp.]HET8858753.1 glycosyltransferase family 52 [Marivirga sp.]